ncbi:flagellar hook-length control protein FliK [Paracoccus liaowanqingii]|uniref:Flagellar hook-length control protein FliK n=1 Tax=Paracoccus liaowanqingii TaxID=2560053 RepID=A0A4Z1CGC4_9RHOB|nr:flagellar hook-length control protein FliK [Paracoccus liaowanqingii]TGN60517.1 flagellar hook-length control protein FliK [Paracoccus liaowanqingii]
MAEIQMTPTWPSRAEAVPETVMPLDGDPGFALMPVAAGTSWPLAGAAMPGAPEPGATASDPLARWLEGMLGMTAEFAAPPSRDPVLPTPGAVAVQVEGELAAPLEEPLPVEAETVEAGTDETSVTAEVPGERVNPESPAGIAVPEADAPPVPKTVPKTVEGEMPPTDGMVLRLKEADARVAPQAGPAQVAPPPADARHLGPPPTAAAPAAEAPPAAIAGGKETDPNVASDADQPGQRPLQSDRPIGNARPGHVAADPNGMAGREWQTGARAAVAGPERDAAPNVAMAGTVRSDPDGRASGQRAEQMPALSESGPSPRAGAVPLPGQAEAAINPDARPAPEFRVADLSRPSLSTGIGGPEVAPDPRPVIRQVTDALVITRGDRTEIALSPEELGRIRLVMSGPDRSQITLWAERPETLELVRRNADLLTQQLAEAGVTADSLDFRRDDRGGGPAFPPLEPTEEGEGQAVPTALRVTLAPAPLSDRRVDIRL